MPRRNGRALAIAFVGQERHRDQDAERVCKGLDKKPAAAPRMPARGTVLAAGTVLIFPHVSREIPANDGRTREGQNCT